MKKIFIVLAIMVLLLAPIAFSASTPKGAVEDYFRAAATEDSEAYAASLDLSTKDSEGIVNTKNLAQEIWKNYDTDEYEITDFDYVLDDNGLSALAKFHIFAKISGIENAEQDLDYVSLLNKINGQWKVSFAMPLGMYDELVQEENSLMIYDDMIKSEQEFLAKEPEGEAIAYFDGKPMKNLSSELSQDENTCTTDEYCKSNELGSKCLSGVCTDSHISGASGSDSVGVSDGLCPGSLLAIFMPITFMVFLRRKN